MSEDVEDHTVLVPVGPCRVCYEPEPRYVEMPLGAFVQWMDDTPLEEAWPDGSPEHRRQATEGTCPHHEMKEGS